MLTIIRDKRELRFLLILVLVHLIYFTIAVVNQNYYPFSGTKFKISDSYQYLTAAENIIKYGIFYANDLNLSINPLYYTIRPPVYPLFLAFFKYFNSSFIIILFFQNIISISSIYLVRNTLLLLNYKTKYDLLFLFLIILTPSQFIYANAILTEVIFQFFIVLMFRYAILFYHNKKNINLLFYSAALILAAFTKPVMYLFVIPSMLYMCYVSFKTKKRSLVLMSFLPVIAVFLIFKWNYNRTNHYEYSSIQTINLLNYNTHLFLIKKEGFDFAEKTIDSIHKKANFINNYAEKSKLLTSSAIEIIRKNLFEYSIYHLQGSFNTTIDPGRFDIDYFFMLNNTNVKKKGILYHLNNGGIVSVLKFLENTYSINLLMILGFILILNIIKIVGFLFFILNRKIDIKYRFVIASIVFYIVLLAGPVGASRYFMPLVPIVIGVILIENNFLNEISNKFKSTLPIKLYGKRI